MKTFKEYINEAYYETDNWVYLYVQLSSKVNWFNDGYLSPTEESYIKDDAKVVVFSTKKNMSQHSSRDFLIKQFEKKHGMPIDGIQFMCSSGDVETGKMIKKIGTALDKGKVSIKDFVTACRNHSKLKMYEPADYVTEVAKELGIK